MVDQGPSHEIDPDEIDHKPAPAQAGVAISTLDLAI
jgi:hypothetical protein